MNKARTGLPRARKIPGRSGMGSPRRGTPTDFCVAVRLGRATAHATPEVPGSTQKGGPGHPPRRRRQGLVIDVPPTRLRRRHAAWQTDTARSDARRPDRPRRTRPGRAAPGGVRRTVVGPRPRPHGRPDPRRGQTGPGSAARAGAGSATDSGSGEGRAVARAFVKAAGLSTARVRIRLSAHRPHLLADLVGGDAYYIDATARCSIGFSVTKAAQQGFVTAGHCGKPGSKTAGSDKTGQGTFQASTFPGKDMAWVGVNANWTATPTSRRPTDRRSRSPVPRRRWSARPSAAPGPPAAGAAAPSSSGTPPSATPRAPSTA